MAYDRKISDKRYREKHRLFLIEKARVYNATHKGQHQEYRVKNREDISRKRKSHTTNLTSEQRVERAEYLKKFQLEHKEELKEYYKRYHQANRDKRHAQALKWKKDHPEIISRISHKRYLKHKEHIRAVSKKWKQANPGKINAMAAKRRAAILKATPPWMTKEHYQAIEQIFIKCSMVSRDTGIEHHVDHIYPLQGKKVSGLHVPWNLQILEGHINLTKSCKLLDNPKRI